MYTPFRYINKGIKRIHIDKPNDIARDKRRDLIMLTKADKLIYTKYKDKYLGIGVLH